MADFIWPIRVYYEDTDSGGVVYYANYLKYMERARTEWLRYLDFAQRKLLEQGLQFVVRSALLDFHYPARLDDSLEVHSHVTETRPASLIFVHDIINTASADLLCRGRVKVACIDTHRFKPKPLPQRLTERLLQERLLTETNRDA